MLAVTFAIAIPVTILVAVKIPLGVAIPLPIYALSTLHRVRKPISVLITFERFWLDLSCATESQRLLGRNGKRAGSGTRQPAIGLATEGRSSLIRHSMWLNVDRSLMYLLAPYSAIRTKTLKHPRLDPFRI